MKKLVVRLLVSFAIGAGFLYLASRQMNFGSSWAAIAGADKAMLLPFTLCMALQHFFRSWRWGQLLAPITPVPFSRLLPISSVGFLAIIALPLRMGEFVRPYLIAAPPTLRMSHALGTMAVERVFDGLALSLTAFVAVWLARSGGTEVPRLMVSAGVVALSLFAAAFAVLAMTLWQRERAVTLCYRLFALVSTKLATRAAAIAQGIVEGFRVLPDLRRLSTFIVATAAYWLLNAVALWLIAKGFALPLTLGAAVALMGLVGIGIMIPAGPGFIGNFELFADGALRMYLSPEQLKKSGAGFILAAHAANASWYLVTGALAMFSRHISFSRVVEAATEAKGDDPPASTPDA